MRDVRPSKPSALAAFGLALSLAVSGMAPFAIAADEAMDDPPPAASSEPSQDAPPQAVSEPSNEPMQGSDAAAPEQTATETPASDAAPVTPSAAAVPATPAADEKPLPPTRPDYYTERAKKTVEQDAKGDAKLSPLQLAQPDQNIVVCEGGCSSDKSIQIVFIEPRSARKPISGGEMIPSSSDPAHASATDAVVTCEGGCYENSPRSYPGVPGGIATSVPASASAGAISSNWVTTVKPVAANASKAKSHNGSGDWMSRISKETGQKTTASPAPAAAAVIQPGTPAAGAKTAKSEPEMAKPDSPAIEAAKVEAAPADGKMAETEPGVAKPIAPVAEAPKAVPAPVAAAPAVVETKPFLPAAVESQVVPAVHAAQGDAGMPPAEKPALDAAAAPKVINEHASEPLDAAAAKKPEQAAEAAAPANVVTSGSMVPTSGEAPSLAKPMADEPMVPQAPTVKPAEGPKDKTSDAADKAPALQVAELTAPVAASKAELSAVTGKDHDPVVTVAPATAEMSDAISKARASLPEFWAKLEKPGAGENGFSIKVSVQGKSAAENEQFWLTDVVNKNGKITGKVGNNPTVVKSVTRGQTLEVSPGKIVDWLYKRNGKMVGNETMRPLLKQLPAQQAASYRDLYEKP